jgi:hypothetical protein
MYSPMAYFKRVPISVIEFALKTPHSGANTTKQLAMKCLTCQGHPQ